MKSKYWMALIGGILVVCVLLSVWLLMPRQNAVQARVLSDGKVVAVVDLQKDQQFTVAGYNGGENVVTVRDGKIAVTTASCPDHHCMKRGYCSGGTAIVCLPNRLVIEFLGTQEVDGAAG